MQVYQGNVAQAMMTAQPQGVGMPKQSDVVNAFAMPQAGQSQYAMMLRPGQELTTPQVPMQQPMMMMQNRPVIIHPRQMSLTPQQFPMGAQPMPTVAQQQQQQQPQHYLMEATVQQQQQQGNYDSSLPPPASVVPEPVKPSTQPRTSMLPQTQSLAGVRTAGAQQRPRNPPIRKSVTINLRPEINSTRTDVNQLGVRFAEDTLVPDMNAEICHLPTEISNQNEFTSTKPNTTPSVSLIQVDSTSRTSQHNNSGQSNLQYAQLAGNYMAYSGSLQGSPSGFYPSHEAPPVEPPVLEYLNTIQPPSQPLQNSNHLSDPSNLQTSQQPPSSDPQPYLLPKALKELPEHKVVEQLEDIDEAPETLLDSSLITAEPGGDSQTRNIVDPASHIRMLKTKQTVMECVMRKLLRSMKQIQDLEPERKNKAETEAEHRLKMARMMQLLMLQRKNLLQQIDTLTLSHDRLLQKHECLKTYSEGCVGENLELNKKYRKLLTERDSKESQIKALMQMSCKLQKKLEGHAHTELALENTTLEMKKLVCDNENLKTANQQLETSYTESVKEREALNLQNSQLKLDVDRLRVELANHRVRMDKVTAENASLRNQLSIAEAGTKTAAKKSVEYGQLKEAYENLQFDHQRLQVLYISETETRRELHNQLQEVNGNIRVISRFRPAEEHDETVESPFEFCAMDKVFVCGKSLPSTVAYQRQLGFSQPQAYTARDEFYAFNRVFQENANQADIFEEIRPIIGSFVDGYNVCILAYGPTGSGKTYTMQGTKTCPGVCRRSVAEVFALCEPLEGIWCTEINIAMFEIHNEVIYDLLAPHITPIKLCDNGSDVRLVNAEEKITTSEQETMHWIEKGYVRRKVSSTRLNSESSRSHLIIRMHLTLASSIDSQRRTSSLVLCDLAGSESAERIDANETLHTETGYINRSLVTLARVFETLRRKSGHCASTGLAIPYRDSKLTHLLKPCLGGQAKCVLIVTASPELKHLDRTLKALEFAQRAMQVSLGRPAKNSRILASNETPRP